jgi:hypothetical protein
VLGAKEPEEPTALVTATVFVLEVAVAPVA